MPHTTTQQPNSLDTYGYPWPPNIYKKLRKIAVRSSKSILLTCIYLIMSAIGTLLQLAKRNKHYPPLTPQSFHPQHILVIRMDLIGDLVLSLTVVRALKRTYPQAEIDLLATPASAKIALHNRQLTEIITYDPNIWRRPKALLQPDNWRNAQALLHRLHARHYDLAVSVYGPWAGLLALLSGAQRRVGFGRESYLGFMTDNVPGGIPGRWQHPNPPDNKHEVDYCLQLAQAAGATITADDRIPHLTVDAQSHREIEQILQQQGVQPDKPLIVCHISSNNGHAKRWPLPYWATLLDRLMRTTDAYVILTGAPIDLPIVEDVVVRMREHPINLVGKTTLPQLAALLHHADLLISGDSGPIHMATALGTPIIGIYGPTNPSLGGPLAPDATVLRDTIWCSPCYNAKDSADCRFYTTQCMKNITPTQVFTIVQSKLKDNANV